MFNKLPKNLEIFDKRNLFRRSSDIQSTSPNATEGEE